MGDQEMVSISRILTFDPGESTGISFVQDGEFVWGMVCRPEAFDKEDFIFALTKMTKPTTIVIESPPNSTLFFNQDQFHIYATLCHCYETAGYNVVKMGPGRWKSLTTRTKIDSGHARDAADMAKVQYAIEVKNGVGR